MEWKPLAQTFVIGVLNWFLIIQFGLTEVLKSETLKAIVVEGEPLQNLVLSGAMMILWLVMSFLWVKIYAKFTEGKK